MEKNSVKLKNAFNELFEIEKLTPVEGSSKEDIEEALENIRRTDKFVNFILSYDFYIADDVKNAMLMYAFANKHVRCTERIGALEVLLDATIEVWNENEERTYIIHDGVKYYYPPHPNKRGKGKKESVSQVKSTIDSKLNGTTNITTQKENKNTVNIDKEKRKFVEAEQSFAKSNNERGSFDPSIESTKFAITINELYKDYKSEKVVSIKIDLINQILNKIDKANKDMLDKSLDIVVLKNNKERFERGLDYINKGKQLYKKVANCEYDETSLTNINKARDFFIKAGENGIKVDSYLEKCKKQVNLIVEYFFNEGDSLINKGLGASMSEEKVETFKKGLSLLKIANNADKNVCSDDLYEEYEAMYENLCQRYEEYKLEEERIEAERIRRREKEMAKMERKLSKAIDLAEKILSENKSSYTFSTTTYESKNDEENYEKEVVDENRKKGDEYYYAAEDLLPKYYTSIYESEYLFKKFDEAASLLRSAMFEYKYASYYKERDDDIKACKDKLEFIGQCYAYLAGNKLKYIPYNATEEEIDEIYEEAIEYYEIAESYGYSCYYEIERCKNSRR